LSKSNGEATLTLATHNPLFLKKQQRSIITAADHYVSSNRLDVNVRFDIVSIVGKQPKIDIQIIENAFYPFL
jgi:putative endonuclease